MTIPRDAWGVGRVLLIVLAAINAGLFLHGKATRSVPPRAVLSLDGDWRGEQLPQSKGSVLKGSRTVTVPADWRDRGRVMLRFEKASHWLRVSWNGAPVGEHYGVRTAASFDVTDQVRFGAENTVEFVLEGAWSGHPWNGVTSTDPQIVQAYVSDRIRSREPVVSGPVTLALEPLLSVGPVRVFASPREHRLRLVVPVRNGTDRAARLEVRASVEEARDVAIPPAMVTVAVGAADEVTLEAAWRDPVAWGASGYGRPFLYALEVTLTDGEREVDRTVTQFGVRDLRLEGGRLQLNGKPLFLSAFQIDPTRYPFTDPENSRLAIAALQAHGFNALESHDERPLPWVYEAADQSAMLMISGSVCLGHMFGPGRPHLEPAAADALVASCREALVDEQPHPSVIMWHPCALAPPLRDAVYEATDRVDPTRLLPFRGFLSEVVNMRPGEVPATCYSGAPVFIDELYPAKGIDLYMRALRYDERVLGFVICGGDQIWTKGDAGRPTILEDSGLPFVPREASP